MKTMTIQEYKEQNHDMENISLPLLHSKAADQAKQSGCMIDGFGMIGSIDQVEKFLKLQNPTSLKRYQYRLWMLNEVPAHGTHTFGEMEKHAKEAEGIHVPDTKKEKRCDSQMR